MSPPLKPDTPESTLPLDRRRIRCRLLLPTIGILGLTAGFGLALILHLVATKVPGQTLHQVVFVNRSLYVDEGLKNTPDGEEVNFRGLLITSLTGHLISLSVPMVMSMVAFRLAAKWVQGDASDSESGDDTHERAILPTPQQYGLLLTVCSSASLHSLYRCARYIFTRQSARPTTSLLTIQAFWVLAVVSILSVAVGLADTWLHAVTSAVLYSPVVWATGDALSAPGIAYGTGFNATVCSEFNSSLFCGQGQGELWDGDTSIVFQGYEVAGNRSNEYLVTTLNDEDSMAIVTRPGVTKNATYTAHSLGLTASCTELVSECLTPMEGIRPVNCSNLGPEENFNFPEGASGFQPWKSGVPLSLGQMLVPQQENSNLFNALVELHYPSPSNDPLTSIPPSPNDAVISTFETLYGSGYMLLANCSFAAYDIVLQASGGQTTLVNQSNASDETTGRLWAGLLYGSITKTLIVNTQGIALTSGSVDEVMADLSQEITRLMLAAAAGILVPIAPDTASFVNSRLISAYPFPPLALFLGLLFIYSAIVIALFVWCAFAGSPTLKVHVPGKSSRTVSLMQLVQMRITNPLCFVASVFDPLTSPALHLQRDPIDSTNVPLSLQTDTMKSFDESRATVRLHAGFAAQEDETPQFAIRQPLAKGG